MLLLILMHDGRNSLDRQEGSCYEQKRRGNRGDEKNGRETLAESVAFTRMGRKGVGPRDLDPKGREIRRPVTDSEKTPKIQYRSKP